MVQISIIKGIINMWKYLLLIYDGREINSCFIFVMVRTPFLFHHKLTEGVVTHLQYLLWCCAILNACFTDIASGFEKNDKDLNCVNLIRIINFYFLLFHVSKHHK